MTWDDHKSIVVIAEKEETLCADFKNRQYEDLRQKKEIIIHGPRFISQDD